MLDWLTKGNEAMARKKKNCQENFTSLAIFLPDQGFMSLNGDCMEENEDRW